MHTRAFNSISLTAIALWAVFFATPAFAAGTYTQNFSSTPANWISVNDTFTATGGYYKSDATANYPQRAIAVYNGTTWNTNYTYSVKLYSDFESDGNRVGVIFNYVDSSNYYEMSVSMRKTASPDPASGKAELSKVIGGVRTRIGEVYHPADAEPWPTRDTYFTVQVNRAGGNTILRVENTLVFNTPALDELGAGRIGFFAQFNNGRFDDVSVSDQALTYLFRSGFNPPVALTQPQCLNPYWFQNLTGGDVPGFTWPPQYWGGTNSQVFNTAAPCAEPMANNVIIQLKTVPGPTGASTQVLSNTVVRWHPPEDPSISPRAGVLYALKSTGTPASRFYLRRYLKYSGNLISSMGSWTWFTQHEFKTGCYDATRTPYPGRFLINFEKNGSGQFLYHLGRDMNNNCETNPAAITWDRTCLAGAGQPCPMLPVDTWFYDELYISYPTSGNGGVVKYAINGTVIFDHTTIAGEPLPTLPNRIKMTPGYLNVRNVEVQADDLEMLADLPCASFPCGPPAHVN